MYVGIFRFSPAKGGLAEFLGKRNNGIVFSSYIVRKAINLDKLSRSANPTPVYLIVAPILEGLRKTCGGELILIIGEYIAEVSRTVSTNDASSILLLILYRRYCCLSLD